MYNDYTDTNGWIYKVYKIRVHNCIKYNIQYLVLILM